MTLTAGDRDDTDGLSPDELASVLGNLASGIAPYGAQQLAEAEATGWGKEWLVDGQYPEMHWPEDVGVIPQQLTLDALRWAAATFPVGTGLGWDAMHPRALCRLSDSTLLRLVAILHACERLGRWPASVWMVIIVLLPKADGGFRPIGLMPLLPRVWMRARRQIAQQWERANERPYLYAGAAKGAEVAAWKQAARAELATRGGTSYAQVLLDLVKAFERVPHDILLREARRLGYPLWLLRLSLATYRLARVLRIGTVVSRELLAIRGITAGSGLATTELRVLMIHVVDVACTAHPTVTPSLYVDDLSAEATGPAAHVARQIAGFVLQVCDALTANRLQLSDKKSICTASSESVGADIQKRLAKYRIVYHRRVKSLGAGLGACCRRNTQVSQKRLKDFSKRLHRSARLDRAGFSTSRILRTGCVAGMVYGGGPQGVSCSTLRS